MIRLLGILIAACLLAGGIAWIADRQGELVFTLDAYEIHMSAAAAMKYSDTTTACCSGAAIASTAAARWRSANRLMTLPNRNSAASAAGAI